MQHNCKLNARYENHKIQQMRGRRNEMLFLIAMVIYSKKKKKKKEKLTSGADSVSQPEQQNLHCGRGLDQSPKGDSAHCRCLS